MPDERLSRWRKERNRRRAAAAKLRARLAAVNGRIRRLNSAITKRKQKLAGGPGEKAADFLLKYVGKTESPAGSNDAPFLRAWENGLGHDRLDWMIPGNPWCGFACIAAYHYGAKVELPDGVVFTPNIVAWAKANNHFQAIPPTAAKKGDLVVFDWNPGSGADHVALALGPAVNGVIPTVEGNTSPSNAGSQSNGGGVFQRSRPVGFIAVVARPL